MNIDYQKMRFSDIDADFKSLEQKEESEKLISNFQSEIIANDKEAVKSNKMSEDDIMKMIGL